VVSKEFAEVGLALLRAKAGGREAEIIAEVREQPAATVLASTLYGGTRVVDMLVGDPLPRIC
jgi:hydrogenase expression/formation protein HypE